MFKNIIAYRFNKPFNIYPEALESAISEFAFSPCGSQDISKLGFSSPFGKLGDSLVQSYGDRYLICTTKEEKILPSSVVKDELDKKVSKIEAEEGRKLAKKEKNAIKDDIITSLLPRAFSRKTTTKAMMLLEIGVVLIDASSASKAEELLALLRKSLGSLPVIPVSFKSTIESKLTDWVKSGETPPPFEILDEAELKSDSDKGSIARFKQQDLTEHEVLEHIEVGKQVHKLALNFGQSISFVLQSDASIKRLKFSEEFMATNDEVGTDEPVARLDADMALISTELVALTNALSLALGGSEDSL